VVTRGRPVYLQVADAIRGGILAGTYRPGDRLPSTSELMDTYRVGQKTVQSAVDRLRAEGYVVSQQGVGFFVRQQEVPRRMSTDITEGVGFYTMLDRHGLQPGSRTTVQRGPASAEVAQWLGIAEGEQVVVRDRLMRPEGKLPELLATSYFPVWVVERAPNLGDPTISGLPKWIREAFGDVYYRDVLSARMPSPDEVERLELPPGTPVITVKGGTYDQQHRALHFIDKRAAAGRIDYSYEYGMVPTGD
jgi:GntR family transcriptional regulator